MVLAHAGGFERGGGTASGEIIRETRQMSDAVDVVVAGHSDSVLDTTLPNRRGGGGKLVVEAAQYDAAYDRVLLTVDRTSGHVVDKTANVRPTWHDQAPPGRRLAALTAGYARGRPNSLVGCSAEPARTCVDTKRKRQPRETAAPWSPTRSGRSRADVASWTRSASGPPCSPDP